MKKTILVALTLACISGCSSWHNSSIADQSKAAEILARDKAFCNQQNRQNVPVGAETDGAPPEPTTYEAEFSENYASVNYFERCMKERGWEKK
ncbi:hypothetical protein [Maridesulfovibrio hydrothermalis]|uniref:Lipoprotein n=1 Tax=Maridesulfovibrio hydrothermalis AM13 = DSM 14728 TaxID=1121451 RepID=L0R6V4_9BACT|nr:hypothetical protein [Maridesulfovibrio hydrothermalis]CCO22443.1 conserved exported protein of unknown function [Maridesulfovibrio hydrothermalis AM13 = DSM 14728]